MSDPYEGQNSLLSFGAQGADITPANGTDLDPVAKCVSVTDVTGGAVLEILPVNNANGEWITYTGVVVGFMPPFRVRRVGENTTCSVASVLW